MMCALWKKRPNMKENIILHHDYAPSHTERHMRDVQENVGTDLTTHPPYHPDLAACDSFLFPCLKKKVGSAICRSARPEFIKLPHVHQP